MGEEPEANTAFNSSAERAAASSTRGWRVPAIWFGANALLALVALWVWMTPLPHLGAQPSPAQTTTPAIAPQLATASPSLAPTAAAGTPSATATVAGSGGGGGTKPTATPTSVRPTPTLSPTATPIPPTPIPPTPTGTPTSQY